jgi:hypothetical protein
MRGVLAALTDALVVAGLGFVAFRLALVTAPCNGNMGDCASLTPLVVLFVLLALVLYFGAGQLLWRSTPGQRLFHASRKEGDSS